MEKEYVVSLNPGVDFDAFWNEMESTTQGLHHVPDRIVDIVNERVYSLRSCHYSLTDQEAEKLRADPRVHCVEIPVNKRTDISIGRRAEQFNNFTKTISNSGSYVNWGLRRCISDTNVYGVLNPVSGPYSYFLDGTGVDVVISDSGLQVNHPEFQDSQGNSRVQQIDWSSPSGQSGDFYRDFDGHGTHVAGIVAGKTYGWAKNASIFSMKVEGLEGTGDSGTGINVYDSFDCIKNWHNFKPIDPSTGFKRPTVVNLSWGYSFTFTDIDGGMYRGNPWSGSSVHPEYGMVGSSNRFGIRIESIDNVVDELIDAGIVVCIAAGNTYQKVDIPSGADYDNYYINTTYGAIYYNRGGSPYSQNAMMVGSVDRVPYDSSTEYKSIFSESGPGVDIYAPGSNIMSCTSGTNGFLGLAQPYYWNANYKQLNISGTSMASPQVAGVAACFLGLNPQATPAQVKSWLQAQSPSTIFSTGLDDDYTNNRSIKGGISRMLYQPFNSAYPMRTNGSVGLKGVAW